MKFRPLYNTLPFKTVPQVSHQILIGLLSFLWLPWFMFGASVSSRAWASQVDPAARELEMGHPIMREFAGEQRHSYQLTLQAGQFLRVMVEQRGANLAVLVFGPDDKQVAEFDGEITTQGREEVTQVAETTGRHRLVVQTRQPGAPVGGYEIRILELRAATEQERVMAQARHLNVEFFALHNAGKYDEASQLGKRVIELLEAALGAEHIEVSTALGNLANLYSDQGAYDKAESLYRRSIAIKEKELGTEHPSLAEALTNLANLYLEQEDYLQAEPLHRRALSVKEKSLGPEHSEVARSLENLSLVYCGKGDFARAEPLQLRALAIKEKIHGPEHRSVAASLNNLASLYWEQGNHTEAERFYERALAIKEKALAPDHPSLANTLHNLAYVYYHRGDYLRAEPMHRRALAIKEKALAPDHPSVANSLDSLASLYHSAGDYARAEPLYRRALGIWERAFGPSHPEVATVLTHLAVLYEARGELAQAVALQARANEVSERNLRINLVAGSERQKLAFLTTLADQTDYTISLHIRSAPHDAAALDLALTTILQRKARVLDAMSDTLGALRRRLDSQDQTLLDQWRETNNQLAKLTLDGSQQIIPAERQNQIAALELKKEEFEAEIGRRSEGFRIESRPVSLATVQSVIPLDSALIEYFSYRPFNAKSKIPSEASGPPRYVAYVLRRQGAPQWVDLGEAKEIDDIIARWRKTLRDPAKPGANRLARQLDERVMRPVRALIGDARRILISPDRMLNLIPFAALKDERNQYLVERYSFSYLTSGRELLRFQTPLPGNPQQVIVADPAFGEQPGAVLAERRAIKLRPDQKPAAIEAPDQTGAKGVNLNQFYFPRLLGTAGEARALKAILPRAAVFTREQATEAALKRLSRPHILHIATHGFFLDDSADGIEKMTTGTRDVVLASNGVAEAATGLSRTLPENPLLRSGLALAGANLRRSATTQQDDDGVMTAMEVAGLDLWGTKLVVLSACDTGVGSVKNGEGVFGLRRALALAGSETQVMSLWPVSDEGARDLMIAYYKALQRGAGRGDALRRVQLQMLKRKDRRRPFYWASFIQSGEWANLDGKR
ncbi:MAG TPA: tetratricopeptide repeat protein [Blastocatellia bacterium]|nr:tetratricopeptide repeat protein [Blastocatellia bacterium]